MVKARWQWVERGVNGEVDIVSEEKNFFQMLAVVGKREIWNRKKVFFLKKR